MSHGRCNDPDCSCRSPDLQWFTNQVLRRDAAKTDYIVIPLIVGVMARGFLAEEPRPGTEPATAEDEAILDQARAVIDLAARADHGESWEADVDAYGTVADLLLCNWPSLLRWGSMSYYRTTLGLDLQARPSAIFSAAERLLRSTPGLSLTESAVLATMVSVSAGSKHNEVPLLAKGARRLRVALADRLRREQLTTWPAVLAAAVNDWTVPTLQRFVQHHAAAGDAAIHYVMALDEARAAQAESLTADGPAIVESRSDETAGATADHDDGEASAAESLVEGAVTEIRHWRSQRDQVQRERDRLAERDTRWRSRIESLERELEAAKGARQDLERELLSVKHERDLLAQRVVVEEALMEDAPTPAPDAFAGRRVLFFTGVEAADARAALTQGFWELGAAQVDCYWTDKARGPDVFPADAIIAVDVTFMNHSAWNTIQDRARASGAWCYTGKHGATTMARATAAALGAHLARSQG